MQVHRNIDQLPVFRNAVITIGTFDGVHMGHRQIIDKLKAEAAANDGETVIITFHPHPRKVVSSTILGIRLISLHNLHFYTSLARRAREAIESGTFPAFRAAFVGNYEPYRGAAPTGDG